MFTFFGQFFDHGLDLANKGGGTVFVPLKDDDPLVPGPDGILNTCTAPNVPEGASRVRTTCRHRFASWC